MYLVVWRDAYENLVIVAPFKSKQAAEKYYAEIASEGEAQVFLCKVLKEHHGIGEETE